MNPSQQKYGPDDIAALFGDASAIVVAKGKKTVRFEPKKASFDRDALRTAVIGPSGNLRAPTLRVGKTWFVGFSTEAYGEKFGG